MQYCNCLQLQAHGLSPQKTGQEYCLQEFGLPVVFERDSMIPVIQDSEALETAIAVKHGFPHADEVTCRTVRFQVVKPNDLREAIPPESPIVIFHPQDGNVFPQHYPGQTVDEGAVLNFYPDDRYNCKPIPRETVLNDFRQVPGVTENPPGTLKFNGRQIDFIG